MDEYKDFLDRFSFRFMDKHDLLKLIERKGVLHVTLDYKGSVISWLGIGETNDKMQGLLREKVWVDVGDDKNNQMIVLL